MRGLADVHSAVDQVANAVPASVDAKRIQSESRAPAPLTYVRVAPLVVVTELNALPPVPLFAAVMAVPDVCPVSNEW
jgi:hypothetical protein